MGFTHPFLKKILGITFFLSIFTLLLFTSIIFNATNLKFYEKQYTRLHLGDELKISKQEYVDATNDLIQYANGKRAEITIQATIDGKYQPVFNEKEKAHMVDVKALLQGLKHATIVILTIMFVILLFVYIKIKKETIRLVTTYKEALFIFLTVLIGLTVLIITEFDQFWTWFHQLFFTNDLWLLDPRTDFMIRMFPLELFKSLVFTILGWFTLGMFLIGLSINLAKKKSL